MEHGIAILYYDLSRPETSGLGLNHDDFIGVYILAQNKENCWNDFGNAFKFHKKNPNLFLNWDFLNHF
ncbi:hypothetical protein E0I26_04755 [Flavobacterium rhamnosiphilum]|uniref:Uncharacterized protein n=1 Tax=Flavobacterium rhamnosiphilum TaxID=2541724 RepID=A0A4R5FB01_9FLAO|nr:hypothetical protein [Flavobacterium rhamnosiphilum]TDE46001.1 hypothetical protein E0I26_04755 [Flavobacterium rhamnosiphilum]